MTEITNPILPGFNPDPSICRVGDDFYIATSTFQWFPGVQIWHSRNIIDWRLKTRALDEDRLLNLRGLESSAGIWAPCLSYSEGLFYLVYTVVTKWRGETPVDFGSFKDTPNFLTTSASIDGPWSDPVFLNASGFDPSLFHDDDRRSWLVNMEWNYTGKPSYFSGILLQEYDKNAQKLTGPIKKIFRGTNIGRTEGPHLYKRRGWYYLMTAEGGTSYEHAVSLARSRHIDGPYEIHPTNPLLNSLENREQDIEIIKKLYTQPYGTFDKADVPQSSYSDFCSSFYSRPQRAGHASICPLSDTEWILAYLCSRPLQGSICSTRGRETAVGRLQWKEDDWPYLVNAQGKRSQLAEFSVSFSWSSPDKSITPTAFSFTDSFDDPSGINPHFRFLRSHPKDDIIHDHKSGVLLLKGAESLISQMHHNYVAVSIPFANYRVEICVFFEPTSFQQMAGLLVHYDERNQFYLRISYEEETQCRSLGIIQFHAGRLSLPLKEEVHLKNQRYFLALEARGLEGQFFFSEDKKQWHPIGPSLDMGQLSDERVWPEGFTGSFVGMACHDQSGQKRRAEFSYFGLTEITD